MHMLTKKSIHLPVAVLDGVVDNLLGVLVRDTSCTEAHERHAIASAVKD